MQKVKIKLADLFQSKELAKTFERKRSDQPVLSGLSSISFSNFQLFNKTKTFKWFLIFCKSNCTKKKFQFSGRIKVSNNFREFPVGKVAVF